MKSHSSVLLPYQICCFFAYVYLLGLSLREHVKLSAPECDESSSDVSSLASSDEDRSGLESEDDLLDDDLSST